MCSMDKRSTGLVVMKIKVNKKAAFDYLTLARYEAGVVLLGWEVKSIKATNVKIDGSYIFLRDGELWIRGMTIGAWPGARIDPDDKTRDRKLLLNRREITRIHSQMSRNSRTTLVPLNIHLARNKIKLDIAVVVGKKKHQKREAKKQRDLERDLKRELKNL